MKERFLSVVKWFRENWIKVQFGIFLAIVGGSLSAVYRISQMPEFDYSHNVMAMGTVLTITILAFLFNVIPLALARLAPSQIGEIHMLTVLVFVYFIFS